MRFSTRTILLAVFFWLAACNFPTPGTLPPTPESPVATPTKKSPASATRTETAVVAGMGETPTPTQTGLPQAGPIPRLEEGTALAIAHIDMIDAEKGWAIGGSADPRTRDHVLWTGNGGGFWKDVTPPENTLVDPPTERVAVGGFWDSETALVTYYSANLQLPSDPPVVWKTTDGGSAWTPSAPLDLSRWTGEYRISDVFFINVNTAWILAHKGDDPASDRIALFQTLNGGNTWQMVTDPAVDSPIQQCEKTGILFTGPWNGWMTGDCRGNRPGVFLFQTFDGGKSWSEAKLPSPAAPPGLFTSGNFSCRIQPPAFFAQQTNLLLPVECTSKTSPTTAAFLFSSNLDGSNWHIMDYPGGMMVVRSSGDGRVYRGDVVSGLAVGEELYIYTGTTEIWEKIDPIDWSGQFDFIDWNKGWAAAHKDGTPLLMYTKDGGRSWTEIRPVAAEG
ncbi:MAG: hypothetical protein JW929_12030 [Anaerolineales bacterium]|nr:hypothetical protein [Anaerolineales bacterium]